LELGIPEVIGKIFTIFVVAVTKIVNVVFVGCEVNPLLPFPERLSSVFSALGDKANS
jgi:hypothetical protein